MYAEGMGVTESGARKKRQKRNMRRAILMTIGLAGVLTVAAVAPGAVQLLKVTGINARLRYQTKTVLGKLKQKGEIEFVERNGKRYVQLTERGERVLELSGERLATAKPKKWDRRYRLVMFDIPERRKRIRDALRFKMSDVGFLRVQDSAWVYPYDCEEFIALLKAELHLGKDVLYAVIEEIDNDAWIRKHFNLPLD
mgnify:CR=1 FL=1